MPIDSNVSTIIMPPYSYLKLVLNIKINIF